MIDVQNINYDNFFDFASMFKVKLYKA
jgi:hypothetical protein